ncbi:acyl carrier protein, partial [Parabacteroides sp.]
TNQINKDTDLIDIGLTSIQVIRFVMEADKVGIHISNSTVYQSRNISNILKNKGSVYCYWGNEYDVNKPILLIVCGYPYFRPTYDDFAQVVGKRYSLLVLESHNEYFFHKENCTLNILLEAYINMLRPILKDKVLFGITGLCLGGEIGLQLAYKLSEAKIATPKVFIIDGFAFREKIADGGFIEEPDVDQVINQERNRISQLLGKSFFFNAYEGETHICLAQQFTKKLRFAHLPEETDPEILKQAFEHFSSNAGLWKQLLPNCHIHYINADHWSILKTEPAQEIKQIIDESSMSS